MDFVVKEVLEFNTAEFECVRSLMSELTEGFCLKEESYREMVDSEDSHLYLLKVKLDDAPEGFSLGILDDGWCVAGCASLCVFDTLHGRRASVEDVVVGPRFRGHGLGKILMGHVLEEAKRMGVFKLQLTSKPSRVAANILYQSLGFTRKDTNYYTLQLT